MPERDLGFSDLTERWAQEARVRRDVRRQYYEVLTRQPTSDLAEDVDRLVELLDQLPRVAGERGLYPATQYDLYQHAKALFDSVLSAALPSRRSMSRQRARYSEVWTC